MTDGTDGRGPSGGEHAAPRSLWRVLPLAVVALGAAAFFATGTHRYFSLEALLDYRDRLQTFVAEDRPRAVAAAALVYITIVALSVPGAAFLTVLCGFLFGWFLGGAVALVSATTGGTILFLVARTSFGDVLSRVAGERLQGLAEGFRQDAFSYLLALRFMPIVPFWLTNLACALFSVRLRTFVIATLIGGVPAAFAFATAGAGLDSVMERQHAAQAACRATGGTDCCLNLDFGTLLTPQLLTAFGALALLSLVPVLWRRRAAARMRALDGRTGGP